MTLHDQSLAENRSHTNSGKKGLKVRLLEKDDTLAVREIMKQHRASTVFRDQEFSDWKLNEHFNLILSRPPRMVCPVATLDGKPVGVTWQLPIATC